MPPALRFSPPPVPLTTELRWVLGRAFAPLGKGVPAGDPERCLRLGYQLDLVARIAQRVPFSELKEQLGDAASAELKLAATHQTAKSLAILALRETIAEIATAHRIPVVWLKFAALEASGVVTAASRPSSDLDILVQAARLDELMNRLQAASLRRIDMKSSEHHPALYRSSAGACVELHVHVPMVRLGAKGPEATLDSLQARGLLEPLDVGGAEGPCVQVPRRSLLVAHAVAHGLVQHGPRSPTYPLLRMFADVVDLGVLEHPELLADALRLIERDVTALELQAVGRVATILTEGTVAEAWPVGSDESRLLRHAIATSIDTRYRSRLTLAAIRSSLHDEGLLAVSRRYLGYAFGLSDEHLRVLYNKSGWSPAWLRWIRPVEFVWRGLRMMARALRR